MVLGLAANDGTDDTKISLMTYNGGRFYSLHIIKCVYGSAKWPAG